MDDLDIVVGADGEPRCWWCGDDPTYLAYHDVDWGTPIHDDRALFELLSLEGFQAGLSWITILRKRPAFQAAFEGFDPEVVATYGDRDVKRLLADAGIVRHGGKIEATIANAKAVLELHEAGTTLDKVVWAATSKGPRPVTRADILPHTPAAAALSKDLKRLGFRFVGPTTVYAFMQSAGIVDDHLEGCWRAH
jgi:DNA-3-methyladenine glycosylase I